MPGSLSQDTKHAGDTRAAVCANLVLCHRATRLYPAEHPRVVHAVDDLRETLAAHQRKTGRPFDLDSTAGGRESSRNADASGRLRHMLRLNRIRKLLIAPEVSCHEIVELCAVLDFDESTRSRGADQGDREHDLVKTLAGCSSIQATFFEFEATPRSVHPLGNLLDTTGIHRSEEIEPILARFPEEHRKRIRSELTSPGFLLKVSILRQALAKSRGVTSDGESGEQEIDLVEEIVQATLPEEATHQDVDIDAFVLRIKRFTELIEKNVDAFSSDVNALPDFDRSLLRSHLRDTINATAALSGDVDLLQKQKERLGFLFQSAPDEGARSKGPPAPDEARRADGEIAEDSELPRGAKIEAKAETEHDGSPEITNELAEDPASPTGPERAAAPPVEVLMRQMITPQVDEPDSYRPASAYELYLFVVLDLLHGGHADTIRRRWPFIVDTLGKGLERPELTTRILRELCELTVRSESEEAEKLLGSLLEKLDHDTLVEQFEKALIPAGGLDAIRRFLESSLERDFGGAVSLVTRLHRPERVRRLRELTHSVLIARIENPDLIVKWACEDVEDLLASSVLGMVLEKLDADRIAALSREIVKRVPEHSVVRLLQAIPRRVEKAQHLLFPALEHGSRMVRTAAIAGLGRCPFDVPARTLIALLRGVNSGSRRDEEEVEAVISALIDLRRSDADDFLREVLTRRRLLFHVYPARLRQTVSDLLTMRGREL